MGTPRRKVVTERRERTKFQETNKYLQNQKLLKKATPSINVSSIANMEYSTPKRTFVNFSRSQKVQRRSW